MSSANDNIKLRVGIIYMYTNKINGHAYIGQTINPKSRQYDHLNRLKKNTGIDIAIDKYGPDNFIYDVLYKTPLLPVEDVKLLLNKKEIYYITKYDTYNNGYNQTKGGNGTIGFPCPEKSKKFRKWYNAHRNELLTEETREKLRQNAYRTYDKRYTAEACQKMSNANKYIQKSKDSILKMKQTMKNVPKRNGVKISFFEDNKFICKFNSRKECYEYFDGKISLSTIKNMLSNKHNCRKYPTYKLIYTDGKNHKNSLISKNNIKKIVQLSIDDKYIKTWKNASECKRNGYNNHIIIECCKHKPHRFSYKGYKWIYEEEYNKVKL